jgi:hypothetical protein
MAGKLPPPTMGIDKYVAGYSMVDAEAKGDKLMKYIIQELNAKKILPARVFSMADSKRSNVIKLEDVMKTIPKLLPSLPKMVIDEMPIALLMDPSSELTLDDFKILF